MDIDRMKKQTQVLQMIAHLNGAVSNSRLYASDHPQVALHMERAYGELRALLAIKKRVDVHYRGQRPDTG
jgi:hypothetical protein